MIIADMNHLEVVSEETNLINGGWLYVSAPLKDGEIALPMATATVFGISNAIGLQSATNIQSETASVSGLFSKSAVMSTAVSVG